LNHGIGNKPLIERLEQATDAELSRLRVHLSLSEKSTVEHVLDSYIMAADNSIFSTVRSVIPSDIPTYSKVLRLIFKEMRSFSSSLDETWEQVKFLKFWNYRSPIEDMTDSELEENIFKMYAAEYSDAEKKAVADPNMWAKATSFIPGFGSAAASAAVAVTAHTATRLPFAAAAPGAVAGPVGLALAVVFMGVQLSGPAYRKIIPATVEIMLIGRRIQYLPKD